MNRRKFFSFLAVAPFAGKVMAEYCDSISKSAYIGTIGASGKPIVPFNVSEEHDTYFNCVDKKDYKNEVIRWKLFDENISRGRLAEKF